MKIIILRLSGSQVSVVDEEEVESDAYEPSTDLILTFDEAGKFVTAQLVKRNEEQSS